MARSKRRFSSQGFKNSQRSVQQLPKHKFRVVVRLQEGPAQTLWLTNDETYAHSLAYFFRSTVRYDAARVQRAVLRNCHVYWESIEDPNSVQQDWPRDPEVKKPSSGDIVLGVLLKERTRRGGWRVRTDAWEKPLVGPVTNSDVIPSNAKPQDLVRIRIAAVDRELTHVQFRWCEESRIL